MASNTRSKPVVKKTDAVNRPSHYNTGKIEVIDFIEDQKLDFHTGNAVKYIARAGKKDASKEIEDLQKSIWYLNRKILNLKQNVSGNIRPTKQGFKPSKRNRR